MKAKLFLLGAAMLTWGGCTSATYTGGAPDNSGTLYGYDASYVYPHGTDMGRGAHMWPPRVIMPVYKEGSPSGASDMGSARPDIIFYR